mmetsp:Transcript_38155/g.77681  ORF Transcript_38155/g.77681 Transcript_38155/m.77681 type:complete len:121 (+) Transcript_38155:113-475(+)
MQSIATSHTKVERGTVRRNALGAICEDRVLNDDCLRQPTSRSKAATKVCFAFRDETSLLLVPPLLVAACMAEAPPMRTDGASRTSILQARANNAEPDNEREDSSSGLRRMQLTSLLGMSR